MDDQVNSDGDAITPFSIPSISKIFTMALMLHRHEDAIWNRRDAAALPGSGNQAPVSSAG